MLRGAVKDNVDVIQGRLPSRLRLRGRLSFVLIRRLSQVGIAAVIVVVALRAGHSGTVTPELSAPAAATANAPQQPTVSVALLSPLIPSSFVSPQSLNLGVKRIVLDPGHGGDNLGTGSAGGLLEKDVTIAIASRLAELMVKRGFEIVMTRAGDESISLRQRSATANEQRGDLFVSIHLNSLQPRSVRGIETYYLGGNDAAERDSLSAVENQQSGYALADMRTMIDRIFVSAKRDESKKLAETVQRSLVETLRQSDPDIVDRGVKTAPFVVLVGTDMPAILAEVSCLSNAPEAERLKTAGYQQTIAEALASGIEEFARGRRGLAAERTLTHGN